MKIYYWTPYMGHVGTIKATINSAIALKEKGHDVKLYKTYREWEGYEHLLADNQIEVIDFGLSKRFAALPQKKVGFRVSMTIISLFSYAKLKKNWEQERPDVIMAYLLGYLPLLARKHTKHKPLILNSIQGKPMFTRFRKWLWNCLYTNSDHMIALSEQTRADIYKNLNYPKDSITVLPNPIIDNRIERMALEPLEEPYSKETETIILGVGRLTRQKNFETLIRAFHSIRKDFSCKLWILGEGEERDKLSKLINELQLQSEIVLTGFVSNPYKYMKKANIFVLSSLWEDPGHVLMEAAYMRMKLVSTRCPSGPEEFLDYGNRGGLCNVQDSEDMSEAIRNALDKNNEIIMSEKIQLAYEKSLEYTLEQHGKKLDTLLKNLVKKEFPNEK